MNADRQLTQPPDDHGGDSRSIGMNTSTFEKRSISRIGWSLVAILAGALTVTGCEQGAEGDRCNPALSHDDCNDGLVCTIPAYCVENYCCPATGTSGNPFCQPGCNGGAAADGAMPPTGTELEEASVATTDATVSADGAAETTTSTSDAQSDVAATGD
jgi:hypothetical protein